MSDSSSYALPHSNVNRYPETRLYCHLEGLQPAERLAHRLSAIQALELFDADGIPVFEEATQMAARFLKMPICVFSIANESVEIFKAATGLSQLGLMNPLAKSRQLNLDESLGVNVLDSEQACVLSDLTQHPAFLNYQLVQNYGIRSYAGVPLITSQGCCIGILAVMDQAPRVFTVQEIAFLEITARWGISEYERTHLQKRVAAPGGILHADPLGQGAYQTASQSDASKGNDLRSLIDSVRLNLIGQLTQDLRNPLTSIIGMASMLHREIYGPLTDKQREYTEIVRTSSQTLMVLVDEIIELGAFENTYQELMPTPVNIAMLGQQVLKTLEEVAEKRDQTLTLTLGPGARVWMLDKGKVKQLLYHLIFSVLQMAGENSTLRLHASQRGDSLNLGIWLSNPWLGEGLPSSILSLCDFFPSPSKAGCLPSSGTRREDSLNTHPHFSGSDSSLPTQETSAIANYSRELLGLLLSRHLAELHGGDITIQGTSEGGYRFVVNLPAVISSYPKVEVTAGQKL